MCSLCKIKKRQSPVKFETIVSGWVCRTGFNYRERNGLLFKSLASSRKQILGIKYMTDKELKYQIWIARHNLDFDLDKKS